MTAKELIEKLKKFDENTKVWVCVDDVVDEIGIIADDRIGNQAIVVISNGTMY